MALNYQLSDKKSTSPADQAFDAGRSPYQGTIGPYRKADTDPYSFRNPSVAKQQDNTGYKNFYNGSVLSSDTAEQAQQKIEKGSTTSNAAFPDSRDNKLANDFLTKYAKSILISEEDFVRPENLTRFANEPAAARISEKDPNTVNKFPSQGVSI